jgi:hypothetical protein
LAALPEALSREVRVLSRAKAATERKKSDATFLFALSQDALRDGLLELRKEITRRRKEEAGSRRVERQWNPDSVIKLEQDRLDRRRRIGAGLTPQCEKYEIIGGMSGIMNSLVAQAKKASADPRDCRRTIDTLQAMGFGKEAFRKLHHLNDTTAGFYRYSERIQRFEEDGNNHRVHQRLMYVLLSCPSGTSPKGKSFQTQAEEAYQQIPPLP